MSNEKLLVPDKIKVGYQKREDTYNGNLAYVIYYDKKGILRKEASWSKWRDESIDPNDFNNEPTEGFVLNKDVGGARRGSSWNPRNEAIRVYDPRGFEFEISLPNLLFILKETTCTKGKGLEGKFVYAWDKTELVLLPVETAEYKKSCEFTDLALLKNIPKKELKYGATYRDRKGDDYVYLGKMNFKHKARDFKGVGKQFDGFVSVNCGQRFYGELAYGKGLIFSFQEDIRKNKKNHWEDKRDFYWLDYDKKVCLKVSDDSLHPNDLNDVITAIRDQNPEYFKTPVGFNLIESPSGQIDEEYPFYVACKDNIYYEFDPPSQVNFTDKTVKLSRTQVGFYIHEDQVVRVPDYSDGFLCYDEEFNYCDHEFHYNNRYHNNWLNNYGSKAAATTCKKYEKFIEIIKKAVPGKLEVIYEDR